MACAIGESPDGFGRGLALAPRESRSDTVSRSPDMEASSSGEYFVFTSADGSASAPASSSSVIDAALPRYDAATVAASWPDGARYFAWAPFASSSFALLALSAAAISTDVPFPVVVLASTRAHDSSCVSVPNNAVRNSGPDGNSTEVTGAAGFAVLAAGSAVSSAIVAQQLAA